METHEQSETNQNDNEYIDTQQKHTHKTKAHGKNENKNTKKSSR